MKALILHGPNLNQLGKRNQTHYGILTLEDINHLIIETFPDVMFDFFQSNSESDIINLLHQVDNDYDFLVINPGGLCHYSIVLRDAFELVGIPKAVVHLSDIVKREPFRQTDLLAPLSDVYIKGLKAQSYIQAIEAIIHKFHL